MKIYIASSWQAKARLVSKALKKAGFQIGSSWVEAPIKLGHRLTTVEKRGIALKDVQEVLAADALVVISDDYRNRGGKFIELGASLGSGKICAVLGDRSENTLMAHPSIFCAGSMAALIKFLKRIEKKLTGKTAG